MIRKSRYLLQAAAIALAIMVGVPAVAQRTEAEIAADIEREARAFAIELERVNTFLCYYDQVQRLAVAEGTLQPGEADTLTHKMGEQLYFQSYEDGSLTNLLSEHRAAAMNFIDAVEREASEGANWASPGQEVLAPARLKAARDTYDQIVSMRGDVLAALESVAEVRAWSQGQTELTASQNPFAGQAERIARSMPDPHTSEVLAGSATIPQDIAKDLPVVPRATPRPEATPEPTFVAYATPIPPVVTPPGPLHGEPDAAWMQRYGEASALYQSGNLVQALPLYDVLLQENGSFRQARFDRAVMRLWRNDPKGSLDDWRILAAEPTDTESRRLRVIGELCSGDAHIAKTEAEALYAMQPQNAQMVLIAGQAALWNGETERGQQLLQSAAAMEPGLAQGLYTQAQSFAQAGVPSMAAVQFATVAWMDPQQTGAYYGLGMAHSAMGQTDLAIQSLESFLSVDPHSAWASTAQQEINRLRGEN